MYWKSRGILEIDDQRLELKYGITVLIKLLDASTGAVGKT